MKDYLINQIKILIEQTILDPALSDEQKIHIINEINSVLNIQD